MLFIIRIHRKRITSKRRRQRKNNIKMIEINLRIINIKNETKNNNGNNIQENQIRIKPRKFMNITRRQRHENEMEAEHEA